MKQKMILAALALTATTLTPAYAAVSQAAAPVAPKPAPVASKDSPIKLTGSTNVVTEVTDASGKKTEKLTPATQAFPGSILQMTQKVQNVGKIKVNGLRLNMRVDPSTIYLNSNCDVPRVNTVFSIDNGKTFSEKPTKTVTVTENGKSVRKTVPATPSEYTNLRWELPDMTPGQTVNCNMRVRVK